MADCRVLGAVMVAGEPLSSSRQRRVLASLAIARGRVVSADRLADIAFNGEPPESANALQTYVSRLRRLLGVESIARRPPGYALVLPVHAVDAWHFEFLVERAGQLTAFEALAVLDEALGLWLGTAYAEFADEDFARPEATRLEELRIAAEVARLDALLGLGRPEEAAARTIQLVDSDPLREVVWDRRMRALHAAGRAAEAVRSFHEYRTLLAEETGLEPSAELAALERAMVTAQPALEPAASPPTLPAPLTTLVGRDAARDELVAALATRRMVTLVGPGGVGKTRLAIEVGRATAERFGRPVLLVELASSSADGVVPAIAGAIGGPKDLDALASTRRALLDRDLLLVLDNCEHVLDEVAHAIDSLLPFCHGLRVLATSRRRLGVADELVWSVPPLTVPAVDAVDGPVDLDGFAATRLFLDRAGPAAAGGDPATTAKAVASICRAVDGLPLGIELAAATARELPLHRIADGLTPPSASVPTGTAAGRHRSLEATIAWSYGLLGLPSQRLLCRLAVFEGGWDVTAAEAVCADDDLARGAVPGLLAHLVAASLVTFDVTNERYRMLETIRSFATARLIDAGEHDRRRESHLRWCAALAHRAEEELSWPEVQGRLQRLTAEHANLLAALRWAMADGRSPDEAIGLAHDLLDYWLNGGGTSEVSLLLDVLLDRSSPPDADRVELSVGAGQLLNGMGDFRRADRQYQRALQMARVLDRPGLIAVSLARAASLPGNTEANHQLEEAESIAEVLADGELTAIVASTRALFAYRDDRLAEAIACYERVLRTPGVGVEDVFDAHHHLIDIHHSQGRWALAREHVLMLEQQSADTGDQAYAAYLCALLARIELAAGEGERARRAYQRAEVWGRPSPDYPHDQRVFDAVGLLLQAESGQLTAAAATAGHLAASWELDGEAMENCFAWLIVGEVLARARDLSGARRCFTRILDHRAGAFAEFRTSALEAIAGTLGGPPHRDDACRLARVAASIRARHALVTPPWLTTALAGRARLGDRPVGTDDLTDEDAVALARSYSP